MSRVITFSRYFPAHHPKKGEPTYFVEKMMAALADGNRDWKMIKEFTDYDWLQYYNATMPKHHTIRVGKRWKVGDKFSPRVWSGKPYASKQIIFAPDIEIKKIFDFEIKVADDYLCVFIDSYSFYLENKYGMDQHEALTMLAKNDGLSLEDMKSWFKWGTPFSGQILCWNDKIEY